MGETAPLSVERGKAMTYSTFREPALITLCKRAYFWAIAALTPVLTPSLPFNTSILDYVNAVFILLFLLYLLYRPKRIEFYLLTPSLVIFLASLISMLNSHALLDNSVALVQEIYLLTYFLILVNIIEDDRDLRTLVLSWMVFAAIESISVHFIANPLNPGRGQGTFLNPNMAGHYLGISIFLIFQPYSRLAWPVKIIFITLIGAGMFATKSLGAMLGLVLAGFAAASVYWLRVGTVQRLKLGLAGLLILLAALAALPAAMQVQDFLDRGDKSADERALIWGAGLNTFLDNPLGIGIGPAGFIDQGVVTGGQWGAGRPRSMHNDVLAFMAERGAFGLIGLLLLLGAVGSMLIRRVRHAREEREYRWIVALFAMFVFTLVEALTHEVMHFRHVWLMFALIAAVDKLARRRQALSNHSADSLRDASPHGCHA